MKTINISYIDFWAECSNSPVNFDEINNISIWNNLNINRELKVINSGVGLFHKNKLENLLDCKINITNPENADLIICSGFGRRKYNFPDKKKIFLCYEADFKILDNQLPNTIYFSSNLPLKKDLFYLPLFTCYYGYDIYKLLKMERRQLSVEEYLKKIDCFSLVSNGKCEFRNSFLSKLNNLINVENYGKLFRNKENSIIQNSCWYDPRLNSFISNYKFIFCFENTCKLGYHTEKIMHGFKNNVIPIYWGDPAIKIIFNSNAYININELGIDKALEKIKLLSTDREEYNKMLLEPIINESSILNKEKISKYLSESFFVETIKNFINHHSGNPV
jgi:hypothetical protein